MSETKGVRRFDYGQITEVRRTPQGFLFVPGFATRVGVFTYLDGDGVMRRELRHPDDVFAPESLETLRYAPVTIEHPPVMITPENVAQFTKGHCTERVEVNRDLVETDLIIEHQDAIDAVEKEGVRDLSCGYVADVEEEVGDFNGAQYNYRQKNIRYNHLAIVKKGRAGPEVRLRLDSQDAVQEEEIQKPGRSEFGTETSVDGADENKTKKVIIAGQEIELPSQAAGVIQDLLGRYDEMRASIMKMEEEMQAKRTDKTDVDISQPGVSPQVKVEQGAPDGRSAPAKVGAADKGGAARAKGDEEIEPKKDGSMPPALAEAAGKKDEEEEKEEKKDYEAPGGAGAGMSPIDILKHELAELKGKHDAMQAKLDEYANPTIAAGEAKPDRMDSIRARVKLERKAEKMVSAEVAQKFDSMSDEEVMSAVILARRPKADLAGKSAVYIQTRFDSIVEAEEEENTESRRQVGRALMGERTDSKESADPDQARKNAINASRSLWQQPLSASKK